MCDTNLISIVSTDVLAPKGARPSAGTVLTMKLDLIVYIVSFTINDFKYVFIFIELMTWWKRAAKILWDLIG